MVYAVGSKKWTNNSKFKIKNLKLQSDALLNQKLLTLNRRAMKKLTFITVILIFCYTSSSSQSCLPEGITFTTQTQIDSFQIIYPGCTEIEGVVRIEGDDITNLWGLNVLRVVDDDLEILNNPLIASLEGLEKLSIIGGDLEIGENNNLINFEGLNILQSVWGDISIHHNHSLINLNGLEGLTHINDDLLIENNDMLTDFFGLHHVTSVGGNLTIEDNNALINLTGLDSLSLIGNDFNVFGNTQLTGLEGVDNLNAIGGSLVIRKTEMLTNLSGLENLNYVDDIDFYYNQDLENLEGLEGLTCLGGLKLTSNTALNDLSGMTNLTNIDYLNLHSNNALADLTGLENISWIGGLSIVSNDGMTSLAGIENIDPAYINYLEIFFNDLLSTCEVQSICDYLANPGGSVVIFMNAPGCNSPPEVASACGFTMPCLPHGNYYFFYQSDVDHFQSNYPGCTALEGNVNIGGYDITNLDSLHVVTSISRDLNIGNWPAGNTRLKDLSGFEGLTSIGRTLRILRNDSLVSLEGLDNLEILGGDLIIGYTLAGVYPYNNPQLMDISSLNGLTNIGRCLHIDANDVLTNLDGLNNVISVGDSLVIRNNPLLSNLEGLSSLTSINDLLRIFENDTLESLSGLDNIEAASISELYIQNNNMLSTCEVISVCNYLSTQQGYAEISNNAIGCNSIEEVEKACEFIRVDEKYIRKNLVLYPNPAYHEFNISIDGNNIDELTIYTTTGKQVLRERLVKGTIDISALQAGMYIVEVTIENTRLWQKLLVQR